MHSLRRDCLDEGGLGGIRVRWEIDLLLWRTRGRYGTLHSIRRVVVGRLIGSCDRLMSVMIMNWNIKRKDGAKERGDLEAAQPCPIIKHTYERKQTITASLSIQYNKRDKPHRRRKQAKARQKANDRALTNAVIPRSHMRHSDGAILHHHRVWIWNQIGRIHPWAIWSLLRNTGHRYSSGVWLALLLRVKHHLLLLLLLRHLGLRHLGLLCGRIVDVTWLLRLLLLLLLWVRRRIGSRRKGILRCIHGLCGLCLVSMFVQY